MVESVTDDGSVDDVDERVEDHRSTETHDTAQPPQSHDNEDHNRDFLPEDGTAADADRLGGQQPSEFETPNSTQSETGSTGFTDKGTPSDSVGFGETSFTISINEFADELDFFITVDEILSASVALIAGSGRTIASSSGGFGDSVSLTPKFPDQTVSHVSVTLDSNSGDPQSFDVTTHRIHRRGFATHSHSI